jgi:hypothetical protein
MFCHCSELWSNFRQGLPEDISREIFAVLPALKNLKFVNTWDLQHILAHLESTDLSQVEVMRCVREHRFQNWLGSFRKNRQLIQRCRDLKILETNTLGLGAFNWATREKMDCENGQAIAPLMPLERLRMVETGDVPLTDELDDIAVAFSKTLRTIYFSSSPPENPFQLRPLYLGLGWTNLVVLEKLSIYAQRLDINRKLLQLCPNLKKLDLVDLVSEYQCQEIITCLPATLPVLKNLQLTGWSALSFHPATLYTTSMLEDLEMSMLYAGLNEAERGCFYIPPIDELEGSFNSQDDSLDLNLTQEAHPAVLRPRWAWDWDLPHLKRLSLTAEFAYRFQFRMLHGCPLLEELELRILTFDDQPEREIVKEDLFLPTVISAHTSESPLSRQSIVAPALQHLILEGSWSIVDELLHQFLIIMLPDLRAIEGTGISKHTFEGLMNVLKGTPNKIVFLNSSLPAPTPEQIASAGLSFPDVYSETLESDKSRMVEINFESYYTLYLMKDEIAVELE